ncbi:MAG TPA: hypothetical protein VF254_00795 [Gammaproteobacteria bacterium]
MKKRNSCVLCFVFIGLLPAKAEDLQFYQDPQAWLYPLFLELPIEFTAENFSLAHPEGEEGAFRNFEDIKAAMGGFEYFEKVYSSNGGFAVYFKKSAFPLPVPYCHEPWLTILMRGPASPDRLEPEEYAYADEKRAIYKTLTAIDKTGQGALELNVVFESEIVGQNPTQVEVLSPCFMTFKISRHGRYAKQRGVPVEQKPALFSHLNE